MLNEYITKRYVCKTAIVIFVSGLNIDLSS